jgi:hypothetical protein
MTCEFTRTFIEFAIPIVILTIIFSVIDGIAYHTERDRRR